MANLSVFMSDYPLRTFLLSAAQKKSTKRKSHLIVLPFASQRDKNGGLRNSPAKAGSDNLRPFLRFYPFSRRQNEWEEELPRPERLSLSTTECREETVSAGQKRVFFVTFFWQDKRKLIKEIAE